MRVRLVSSVIAVLMVAFFVPTTRAQVWCPSCDDMTPCDQDCFLWLSEGGQYWSTCYWDGPMCNPNPDECANICGENLPCSPRCWDSSALVSTDCYEYTSGQCDSGLADESDMPMSAWSE